MTGNLLLSIGGDRLRTMGCRNLSGNKVFDVFLGSTANKIHCWSHHPITLETTDGFLCKRGLENLVRFGISSTDLRTSLYRDLVMNNHYIVDLQDPALAQDAATKNYVDNCLSKRRAGYIPILEADVSSTGFVASASSNTFGHEAYTAFNNLKTDGSWFSGELLTCWLQIKCPEPVIIWRLALKAPPPLHGMDIQSWNLSVSNDGVSFIPTMSSTNRLSKLATAPEFFTVHMTTAYQYYRVTIAGRDANEIGVGLMQLYILD